MNLFEVSARFQQLLDKEEYTPEEMDELSSLHASLEDSCVERGKYIKNLEAERDAVLKEAALMKDRADALDAKAQMQRQRLINIMQENKMNRVEHPLMNIVIPKPRASVDIVDQDLIPEQYIKEETKVIVKVSKSAIQKAISEGREVPGVQLKFNTKVDFK